MTTANLPPQAYTREVFANAYDWLQNQPRSVKELAKTPDELVALYLQARRHRSGQSGALGWNNDDAPVSSRSFKNDLKNLAEGLKQFEQPPASPAPQPSMQAPQYEIPPPPVQAPPPTKPKQPAAASTLDSHSQQIIQEVKSRLNLSSDSEVVRMLLVLGYEKVKDLFKR